MKLKNKETKKEVKEAVEEMQKIVQGYFENVLELPCPDFTENFYKK